MKDELLVILRASYHFKVGFFFVVFLLSPSPPLPTPILRLACATPIFVIPLHSLVVVIPPRRIPQPRPPVVVIPLSLRLPNFPRICLPLPSSSSPRLLPPLRSPPHSQAGLHYPYVIWLFALVYCIACSCTCIMLCCHPPSIRSPSLSFPSIRSFVCRRRHRHPPCGLPAPRLPITCSYSGRPALPLCYLLLYFCLVYCIACTCIMLCRRHPTPSARRRCHSPNAPSSGPVCSSSLFFP